MKKFMEGMERGVITYSASFLSGTIISFLLPFNTFVTSALLLLLLILTIHYKKRAIPFIVCSHLALFTAGECICSTSLHMEETSPPLIISTISSASGRLQDKAAGYLRKIAPDPQSHATLCAISIGEKRFMGKDLKRSYSVAGAMHVLAVSGLHTGIAFAIIHTLLLPLVALPGGRIARDIIALIFIVGYSIFSGYSPSVIRAATMIILYKIAYRKFRNISNWDAIAISAMIIIAFSPLQIKDIGFQLSYCAVMGIALLFPLCNTAFRQIVPQWKGNRKILWKMLYWLWSSLAISVCCQITTLPVSIYHFGYSAPYFLLANLAAVPLATGILYTLTLTICLQWIPVLGEWCTLFLNLLIKLLNSIVMYISV